MPGERRNDVFGDAVGKILLFRIGTEIDERNDRDARLAAGVGQR